MDRRGLLRLGAGITAAAISVKSLPLYAAMEISGDLLNEHEQETLTRMAEMLLPHQQLSRELYRQAILGLVQQNSQNAEVITLLKSGVRTLDSDEQTPWMLRPPEQRLSQLDAIASTPFFRLVRNATIEYLYRQPRVQEMLGYEGPSIRFGGYLHRGLNDIDWLPET